MNLTADREGARGIPLLWCECLEEVGSQADMYVGLFGRNHDDGVGVDSWPASRILCQSFVFKRIEWLFFSSLAATFVIGFFLY